MTIKQHLHKTKILDGNISLGRGYIDVSTLLFNGNPLPVTILLNARNGTARWADQNNLGLPDLHTFEYDHFAPTEISIVSDKEQIDADGIEEATLTITCEDLSETLVKLGIYDSDDEKIGSLDVVVNNGTGQQTLTSDITGNFIIKTDSDELDLIWNIPKFSTIQSVKLEVI